MKVIVCYTHFEQKEVEIPDNIVKEGGYPLRNAALEQLPGGLDDGTIYVDAIWDMNDEVCYGEW